MLPVGITRLISVMATNFINRFGSSVFVLKSFCYLAALCVFCNASAQTLPFSGKVLDEHGAGLSAVYLIAVDPENSEVLLTTASDDEGNYVLESLPSRFTLNITRLGYESLNIPVESEGDLEAIRTIKMQVASEQIEEAVVKADVPQIQRKLGKFVISDIAASPYAKGSTALNFLRFMPMVDVNPEGGISILGKTDANILIDGRSVGSNDMAEQMLKGIPANEIARIEIIPVTGSSYSASNRSGIINVVLKRPDEGLRLVATVEDRQGYYNSPRGVLYMNYAGKRVALTAGMTASYSQFRQDEENEYNYFQSGLATQYDFQKRSQTLSGNGYVNLDYKLADRHRLGAQISVSASDSRDNSSSVTSYGSIGSTLTDSVYRANVTTKSPVVSPNWRANLNYVFNTDDKGSRLNVDFDFRNYRNKSGIHSVYQKDSDTSSEITDDFLQQTETNTRVYGGRVAYLHNFNEDNTLRAGISAYGGKVDSDFFYGINSDEGYVSDPGRSNNFVYKDFNLAGYVTFERVWSDKFESEIGVRIEKYNAQGIQKTGSETISRNEFDIFPSISLLYMPSDSHEFGLDFSTFIWRPSYWDLNPFTTYTSPTTYIQNNADLRSSKEYELMFSYTLMDDYMLMVDYYYDDDLWTDFTLASGDMTRTYKYNYGNGHSVDVMLLVSKSLFKNYWNLSLSAMMSYNRTLGAVSDQVIDLEDIYYDLTFKSNLALSKKHKCYLNLKYQYLSKQRWAAYELGAHHEMEIYLMKQFKRASLSAGVYNLLLPAITKSNTFTDYQFSTTSKRYVTGVITFSYTFGNQRARRVSTRQNQDIESRM